MLKFGIRTLLGVTALVAMILSVWQHQRLIMDRIVSEHYLVMENGFRAIDCQRPVGDPVFVRRTQKDCSTLLTFAGIPAQYREPFLVATRGQMHVGFLQNLTRANADIFPYLPSGRVTVLA